MGQSAVASLPVAEEAPLRRLASEKMRRMRRRLAAAAVTTLLTAIVAVRCAGGRFDGNGYRLNILASGDFPTPGGLGGPGGTGWGNPRPPIDYGVADRILNNNTGGMPALSITGPEGSSRKITNVAEDVVHQRQNISGALRLFERLLPALGYDDKVQKSVFKMERERSLEMLKASQARFGKLKQEKSNMEKELRKMKTIERMRIREGAKASPILNEAKVLVAEAIEKLDAAIDISEGEFKPVWLETVRENQIIKSEQRAKDSLVSAYRMLNQQFTSGHIFLPGCFVQLVPELPFITTQFVGPRSSTKLKKILQVAVPLLTCVSGLAYGFRIAQSRLTSVLSSRGAETRKGWSSALSVASTSKAPSRIASAAKILQNLDLFIAVRAAQALVLGFYRIASARLGGPETHETAKEVLEHTGKILSNLDIVLLSHAVMKIVGGSEYLKDSKLSNFVANKVTAPDTRKAIVDTASTVSRFLVENSRTILFSYLMYRVTSSMTKAFEGVKSIKVALPGFRRVDEEEEHQGIKYDLLDVPEVSFDDVAGLANLKNEVTEIVDFLKEGRKYGRVRAKAPKGVLMTGPPGCGKTLLAKAIAGEAGICFLPCVGSDFNSNIAGSGSEKMRAIWAKAEKNAPCILFIDEIDYVGSKRTEGSKGGAEQDRTGLMTVLLAKMDGINSRDDIFVIATSNRLDILDPALLRPGRFDRHVELTLPDTKGRIEVLNVHARDRPFAENVNLENIARKTSGFSGAELANVINEAAIHAGRRSSTIIEQEDLESAYHKVILGVASERKQTLDYRKSVAVHEAGHAVLAMIMKKRFGDDFKTVTQVSILPRSKGSAGVTCFMNPQDEVKRTKSLLQADLSVGLGGRAAEEIWYGKDGIQLGASSDIETCTQLANRMVTSEGMASNVGLVNINHYSPEEVRKSAHGEVKHLLDTAYEKAKEILRINEVLHRQMVYTLLREETIGEEQLNRLAKLYPPAEE